MRERTQEAVVIEVRENPERERFEVFEDGELAGFAQYIRRAGRLIFVHTEVDEAFEGRGIGSKLAAGALDAARANGDHVLPLCPFISSYIDRHPQYADLVDDQALAALDAEPTGRRVDVVAEDLAMEGGFD